MGNLGGMEVLVIFLVALIVLGPTKLPDAARQVGKAMNEVRRISGGFQREMREAMQEPFKEEQARDRGTKLVAEQRALRAAGKNPYAKPDTDKPSDTDSATTQAEADTATPATTPADEPASSKPDPDAPTDADSTGEGPA